LVPQPEQEARKEIDKLLTLTARFLRYVRRKPNKRVSTRKLRPVVHCSFTDWLRAMSGRSARRGCGQGSGGHQHTTVGYSQNDVAWRQAEYPAKTRQRDRFFALIK
jgi:hypothetical protein